MKNHKLLLVFVMGLVLALSACVGATTIVFDNETVCGTIRVDLTNTQTSVTEVYQVEIGETVTIEVSPNVVYSYVVDYTAAGENAEGFTCTAVQRGQVSVPPGSSQKFNLTAVTPTPET